MRWQLRVRAGDCAPPPPGIDAALRANRHNGFMTTATHRRRPADANDHRGRLSAGTFAVFSVVGFKTQLAAALTCTGSTGFSRRQRPGRLLEGLPGRAFVIALIVTVVAAVLQRDTLSNR